MPAKDVDQAPSGSMAHPGAAGGPAGPGGSVGQRGVAGGTEPSGEWGDRPVPVPDGSSAKYWAAAAAGEMLLQACRSCGAYQFYPRLACRECGGVPEWRKASGRGIVHTFTVIHQNGSRAFRERVPYVVAMVELEEGPRMMSNVVDCLPEEVHIGMPVVVCFVTVEEGVAIPQFRPRPAVGG